MADLRVHFQIFMALYGRHESGQRHLERLPEDAILGLAEHDDRLAYVMLLDAPFNLLPAISVDNASRQPFPSKPPHSAPSFLFDRFAHRRAMPRLSALFP